MKSKFFLLSTIVSSCILAIACNQAGADDKRPSIPSGKQKCYPGSKCTGDPNLIHQDNDQSEAAGNMNGKEPQKNGNGKSLEPLKMNSVEAFKGTVKRVDRVQMPNGTQIQLVLTTDQGDMLIIVGPASFVDKSKVKMQAGDKLEVSGYMIKANGDQVMMASEIKKNGNSLQLRDQNRQPMWQQ